VDRVDDTAAVRGVSVPRIDVVDELEVSDWEAVASARRHRWFKEVEGGKKLRDEAGEHDVVVVRSWSWFPHHSQTICWPMIFHCAPLVEAFLIWP
jgi:hypothetical protein